jgi:uncharacterized membrane protein
MLPPWPGWDGLHPLVIHFPIALVLVAPVFVLLAIVLPRHTTFLAMSALLLLALGTVAAFVAVETGEAAAELVTRTDAINQVLERHAELAETARNVLAVLTLLYAVVVFLPFRVKALDRATYRAVAHTVFLVLMLGAGVLVANAAHQGGLLVHQLGVHAMMPPGT